MWALVWLQLISGQSLEYYHIATYNNYEQCEARRERAEVMITHNGIGVVCLDVTGEK
jgi:hypothetical protein|tara:strand:+ start:120 stop:290 length:171 start_codon:yes stop_codon:yes gene_type:complete